MITIIPETQNVNSEQVLRTENTKELMATIKKTMNITKKVTQMFAGVYEL